MSKEDFYFYVESELHITLSDEQKEKLELFASILLDYNKRVNLTAIRDVNEVYLKHFYDSLTLFKAIDLNKELKLCDIGTGAGFPGIVLKIVFPTLSITLVDALLKRVNFLNLVIKELGLENIEAIHSRAEDYVKFHKNEYDIVTSRAVSRLSNLIDYSVPLLKKDGSFIPMKANCEDEITEIKKKLSIKKIRMANIIEFNLPYENSHITLIEIKKLK